MAQVLGTDGLLAGLLPAYEARPQQMEMAGLVEQAIATPCHAVVEAPTGVGKSFAYLVPAALHALRTGTKVVISTGTIALQEQLIGKDIPLLQRVLPGLIAVLVKGRQNYLSRRRLAHALGEENNQTQLLETREDRRALHELARWAKGSEVGDLADLGEEPAPAAWRAVVSDRANCMGRKCPTFGSCFFYQARQRMEDAHLLVVNHHLYFSDLSLRDEHAGILPAHDVVVFDEAHSLEDVATDHLGLRISEAQVRFLLDGLWSRHERGLLARLDYAELRGEVTTARAAHERFWQEVTRLATTGGGVEETVRLSQPQAVENVLSPCLDAIAKALAPLVERADDDNAAMELTAQITRLTELSGSLRALIDQRDAGLVYFAAIPRGKRSPQLAASPLVVAELLKERLFDATPTVVLTSATLAADDSDRFLFLRRRLGVEDGLARRLGSPFDYQQQARLMLNRSTVDPNSPRFEHLVATWLTQYLLDPERGGRGGSFVLFTSYRQLQAVHDAVRPALDRAHRFVLRHGSGIGRGQMLDLFKRTGDAVLFGTSSFWEGVDVPGDALRHVIIAKLPFEMPDHPVTQARAEALTRAGRNAFLERSVPEAILRLKQGFGRLIRTRTDTGSVVILDHRILSKTYGRYFLRALPQCRTEIFSLDPTLAEEPGGQGNDPGT